MVILTPTEIDELLINRLTKTIDLYKKLDTTETEIYNTIYFSETLLEIETWLF